MRISIVLLLLLGFTSFAEDRRKGLSGSAGDVDGRVRSNLYVRSGSTVNLDPGAFVLAPSDGTGMTAACACTDVAPKGVGSFTFTRGSTAWCTKANQVTGIQNGDLVECAADKPRVELGGNGAETILGIGFFGSGTNTFLRSQEFDNAAWTKWGVGVAAPVVTADQAVAPDGTTTADKVDLTATSAAQRSSLYQIPGITTDVSMSVYVKGVSTSGTIDLCTANGGGASCTSCAFVSTSWTRCFRENVSVTAGANSPTIGNNTADNGGTARPTQSVYLWQADHQETLYGSGIGPPITTTGTAATRLLEQGSLTVPFAWISSGSAASNLLTINTAGGLVTYGGGIRMLRQASQKFCIFEGITDLCTPGLTTVSRTVPNRGYSYWATDGGMGVGNTTTGSTAAGAFAGAMGAGSPEVGNNVSGSGSASGILKRICFDSDPTVCR
jgi:hypothetical protein